MGVEFDFNGGLAGFFDRLVELDGVAVDGDSSGFEFLMDVHVRDGAECLAALARGKGEGRFEFADLGGELLGDDDFLGFALGTAGLEGFDVAEVCLGRFVCLALWDEVVTGVSGADFYNIGFGSKAFDFFFEDDLCVGHGGRGLFGNGGRI